MAAVTQHRPSDALAGRRYGSFAGKPAFSGSTHPVDVLTQHRPDAAIGGKRYGSFAGRAGVSIPTITSVTAVSGTELAVAWTGTATEYRLNGGTATALPDGTSPDTISGLTPNTFYTVELRDGAGAWSTGVGEWTDNTGSGGGSLALDTGRADEADTAYSLAITKILATGLAVETDTALDLSLAPPGIVPVGRADETDTAYPLALVKILEMGLAAETDTAIAPDFGATGGGTGATAAQIWGYVMSNGQTAEENVLTMLEYLSDLHLIHGLRAGSPLSVTETERSAGAVVQAISEAAGVVTVTR